MGKLECVGIDVSAKSLAVASRGQSGHIHVREIANTPAGHKTLCKDLGKGPTRVCLEAPEKSQYDLPPRPCTGVASGSERGGHGCEPTGCG